jgi:iron(III) transport system substrate-binding protein
MRRSGKKEREALGVIAAVVITVALAACSTGAASPTTGTTGAGTGRRTGAGTTGSTGTPIPVATLKQQAQHESGLVIYANIPTQYFQPVIAAFGQQYPGIHVSVSTLEDNQVFSKYEAEAAQGARTADLLIASAPATWVQAEQNGVAANVTPQNLGSFPGWVNQGHGVYVMSAEPVVVTYNTRLLTQPQRPTTWAQLAQDARQDPAKYKMVSYVGTNPLNVGGIYGLIHILGANKVWGYYDKLATVTKTFNDGLDALQLVLQGAASVGYMGSGLAQGVLPHYKDLVSYGFMQDATPLIPRGIAVSAKASSPASAQLFLDFLYSQAGQQALCLGGFESTMNGFTSPTGCTATLQHLQTQVPASAIYLVPISQDVLNQQDSIIQRWNQAFHR